MKPEPIWLSRVHVEIFHEAQLREHGGLAGLRDPGALESALERPRNRFLYEAADLPALAAAYADGIARSHPFNDGNKRTALVTAAVFLEINGMELTLSEPEAVTLMVSLASSEIDAEALAAAFRDRARSKH